MYCPNCGNQNLENVKFCRACGGDLETVALALNNKLAAPPDWMEKYGESKSNVATGALMAGGGLMIWLLPALLLKDVMGWTAIWACFFGWLTIWGFISLANSVGSLVKAKTMLKAHLHYDSQLSPGEQYGLPSKPANFEPANSSYKTDQLQTPHSVTEHTTKFLNEK